MIFSASIGSIIIQIFIIWLISNIFSKKKKKGKERKAGNLRAIFKDFIQNISNKIEDSINEIEIVSEEFIDPQIVDNQQKTVNPQPIPPAVIQPKPEKLIVKPIYRKNNKLRFGLNSKSKIKNAIILNEIIGKPVSLRR